MLLPTSAQAFQTLGRTSCLIFRTFFINQVDELLKCRIGASRYGASLQEDSEMTGSY
jgi:hypothetical protein